MIIWIIETRLFEYSKTAVSKLTVRIKSAKYAKRRVARYLRLIGLDSKHILVTKEPASRGQKIEGFSLWNYCQRRYRPINILWRVKTQFKWISNSLIRRGSMKNETSYSQDHLKIGLSIGGNNRKQTYMTTDET